MSLVASAGRRGDASYIITNGQNKVKVEVVVSEKTRTNTLPTWEQAEQWLNEFLASERYEIRRHNRG